MSVSPCPCLYVSLSPSLHVHVSISPCLMSSVYVSMSPPPCLHLHVSTSMSPCPCLHASGIPQTENRTNGKQQLLNGYCKRKTENSHLFAANRNRKWKFVFLGWQLTKGNQRVLFQQMCPSKITFDFHFGLT
jgi:hypothetical protein